MHRRASPVLHSLSCSLSAARACAPLARATQEKLCLDLDDEQAIEALQALINESATALMPQIVETTHRWAQYWR